MRRAIAQLKSLLRFTDPQLPEFWEAFIAFVWGLWLLLPWETFDRTVLYRALWDIAPEEVWGAAFLCIGTAHMMVVLVGGRRWRQVFSAIGVLKWSLLFWLFIVGGLQSAESVLYGAMVAASVWAFIRIGLMKDVARP